MKTATQRSRERYKRAHAIIANVTLNASEAAMLAVVLRKTRERKADLIRRLIRDEYERV